MISQYSTSGLERRITPSGVTFGGRKLLQNATDAADALSSCSCSPTVARTCCTRCAKDRGALGDRAVTPDDRFSST
jgi:hypothetical protein